MPETATESKKWSGYNGDRPIKTTGSLEPMPGRCGKKLKFTGTSPENPAKYCMQYPSKKLGIPHCAKCAGGAKNRGIAHGNFRTGEYCEHLPKRIQDSAEAGLNDPDLISLRGAIAVTRAREIDLFKRVDSGEAGAIWRSLKSINQEFKKARAAADPAKMQECLDEQTRLIDKGLGDSATWAEIHQTIEQRRKLIDSELKRLQALQIYVDSGPVLTMLNAIAIQLKEIIENRDLTVKEQLSRTQLMLSKFMGQTTDRQKQALD
jgi:hypothetical protein